ncbi:MAG: apolipoprotein N-acyltransferase [Verrucomicrobia bacterium]|nr:apolipoprotein N-acyltransferase [Verrucomicrobiota bacterium]
MRPRFHVWPWLAAILSGLLLTLCFPSFPGWEQGWLCWVALTPLIAAVWFGGGGIPRALQLGYLAGLIFFWGVFSWLTTVSGLGWFLLPFYLALYPAAWAAFLCAARGDAGDFTRSGANLRLALLGAAAWVALEWLRGLGALSFGWNGLGIALHGNLALIQIAEFTGVGGLSFLVALTNLIAVLTVRRFWSEARLRRIRPHWDFSTTMALIAAVFAFGVRILFAPAESGSIPLRVAAVQANIPQEQKFDRAYARSIQECYTRLTEIALATRPQLLLWPEAATPGSVFESQEMFDFVSRFAQTGNTNLLLGTLDSDQDRHDYNIAALFTGKNEMPQTYRKMHLVPFGEYIPFRRSFPPFEWVAGDLVPGDFTPGSEYTVLKLEHPSLQIAALVCFEDTLGDLTRRFVQRGAQLLVNVTNDGWFLRSQGAEQHLNNAVFRAVENRRPLVRAANTGVTAFIDPLGRVANAFRPDGNSFAQGVLSGTVQVPPAMKAPTFYTRHGERFSHMCAAGSLAALGVFIARRRRKGQELSADFENGRPRSIQL